MAAGSTYTPIYSTTLGSSATDVTFTSFSGYTDLMIVCNSKSLSGAGGWLQFNGDTGSNYSFTIMYGESGSAASYRQSSQTAARYTYAAGIGNSSGQDSVNRINIMNYANTTTYKTFLTRSDRASQGVDAIVGLWRSTAAITSIKLFPLSDSFATGSTFTIYGIAAA